MSIRLYIGNLPKELDRQELAAVFAEEGNSVSTKVITDRKTGKCRGFGFVTVKTDEQADQIIEKFNGYMFKENALKIEKALPRSKGKNSGEEESATASSTPSPSNSGRKNNKNNKSRRSSSSATAPDSGATQVDPRWADDLAKLKQLLAAQTTNS